LYSSPKAGLNAEFGIGEGQKVKEGGVQRPRLIVQILTVGTAFPGNAIFR